MLKSKDYRKGTKSTSIIPEKKKKSKQSKTSTCIESSPAELIFDVVSKILVLLIIPLSRVDSKPPNGVACSRK